MISILLILLFILVTNLLPISINITLLSFFLVVSIYKFPKIFSKDVFFYFLATGVAIFSTIFNDLYIFDYVLKGYLSIAIFIVIMFTGVIPIKWKLTQILVKTRGLLSIIGFILISPHATLHLLGLFSGINLFGIAAYALMIPLTIISFKTIRREINPRDWKNIQKASYIIYGLLYLHILWVGSWTDKLVYIVLFVLYINNKLFKEFKK